MAFMLLSSLCAFSQEADKSDMPLNKEVMHSTTFGLFGTNEVYDSYLSPNVLADAVDFRMQRETARMTNLMEGRISNQTFLDVNFGCDFLDGGTPYYYTGGIRYSQGWLYNFRDCNVVNPGERTTRQWNYAVGLQASAYLGGVYLDRSGNNPGQAKMDVAINATGIVSYSFRSSKHRPIVVSYQLTFPLAGVAFSPNYGQSYYEIFKLHNYDHNIVFAHPFNMPSNRHRLLVNIPIRRAELRLGYDAQVNQAAFNQLEYRNVTMDFMIGFTKYFYRR